MSCGVSCWCCGSVYSCSTNRYQHTLDSQIEVNTFVMKHYVECHVECHSGVYTCRCYAWLCASVLLVCWYFYEERDGRLEGVARVLFCFELFKTASRNYEVVKQTFDEDIMGRSQASEWFFRFRYGNPSVKITIVVRPQLTEPTKMLWKWIMLSTRTAGNHLMTVAASVVHHVVPANVLHEASMRQIAATFMPGLVTQEWRQRFLTVHSDLQEQIRNYLNFLPRSSLVMKSVFTATDDGPNTCHHLL